MCVFFFCSPSHSSSYQSYHATQLKVVWISMFLSFLFFFFCNGIISEGFIPHRICVFSSVSLSHLWSHVSTGSCCWWLLLPLPSIVIRDWRTRENFPRIDHSPLSHNHLENDQKTQLLPTKTIQSIETLLGVRFWYL